MAATSPNYAALPLRALHLDALIFPGKTGTYQEDGEEVVTRPRERAISP